MFGGRNPESNRDSTISLRLGEFVVNVWSEKYRAE